MNPPPPLPPPPPGGPRPSGRRKKRTQTHPQSKVSRFWSRYHSKTPGKVTSIFPQKLYKDVLFDTDSPENNVRNAGQSYEAARSECIAKVRRAVAQCERTNSIFTDPDFDIETDYDMNENICILGLSELEEFDSSSDDDCGGRPSFPSGRKVKGSLRTLIRSGVLASPSVVMNLPRLERYVGDSDSDLDFQIPSLMLPRSVHRVSWIFESPQFTIDGYSSSDIKQGALGDCWWVAAVGNIAHRKDLMEKICVARDEECGIYGFVFHRDGEWISTIIDDNLYLANEDHGLGPDVYDARGKKARLYKKEKQTGSEALFYSKCEDENETWLPLMEKAFAKVHGDYQAMHGGWLGCGVEDLTGGVTSFLLANRVLRKDRLWREMLSIDQDSGDFVFGVSAQSDAISGHKNGLILNHAYSVLKAVEVENEDGKKVRLIKMRNPWGQKAETGFGEWHGPWSDGSKEWTPFMLKRLRYEFGDDGIFWMSFEDVLNSFKWIHRTRLFDEKWTVAQQWTSDPVSWVSGYLKSKFVIEIKTEGMAVIVLAKLDSRYFLGLEGQYRFYLAFALRKAGTTEILAEARGFEHSDRRSVNCELYLEPGVYEVLPMIRAKRKYSGKSIEQVLRDHADKHPRKLQQVGRQYDLAHGRAGVLDEEAEQERKKQEDKKKKKKQKKGQQPKADKIQEMKDAMTKMQVAMTNMQNELTKKDTPENDGNQMEIQKPEDKNAKKADGDEIPKAPKGVLKGAPTKLTPGLWPGCSFEAQTKDQLPQRSQEAVPFESQTHSQVGMTEPSDGKSKNTPDSSPDVECQVPKAGTERPSGPPPPNANGQPTPADSSDSDSDSDSDSSSDSSASEPDSGTADSNPRWNPVCVTCLRVYTQDKEVSIKLVKNEAPELSKMQKPVEKDLEHGKDEAMHKVAET